MSYEKVPMSYEKVPMTYEKVPQPIADPGSVRDVTSDTQLYTGRNVKLRQEARAMHAPGAVLAPSAASALEALLPVWDETSVRKEALIAMSRTFHHPPLKKFKKLLGSETNKFTDLTAEYHSTYTELLEHFEKPENRGREVPSVIFSQSKSGWAVLLPGIPEWDLHKVNTDGEPMITRCAQPILEDLDFKYDPILEARHAPIDVTRMFQGIHTDATEFFSRADGRRKPFACIYSQGERTWYINSVDRPALFSKLEHKIDYFNIEGARALGWPEPIIDPTDTEWADSIFKYTKPINVDNYEEYVRENFGSLAPMRFVIFSTNKRTIAQTQPRGLPPIPEQKNYKIYVLHYRNPPTRDLPRGRSTGFQFIIEDDQIKECYLDSTVINSFSADTIYKFITHSLLERRGDVYRDATGNIIQFLPHDIDPTQVDTATMEYEMAIEALKPVVPFVPPVTSSRQSSAPVDTSLQSSVYGSRHRRPPGGSSAQKYLKYKMKYLALKNLKIEFK